jgi:integrase
MKLQLTDRFCQHAKSTEPQTDYFDASIPGLALRVTSRGTKAWTFLHGTPRRRITLGRYPALSLAAARTLAIETREGHTAGSVAALAEVYIKSVSDKRTAPEIERRLRKDALPIIGHIPIRELHRRDITRVIDSKSSAPIAGRKVFEDLRAMVRWAVARGDLDHNPIDGMKGPAISKPRDRVLTDEEIRALWHRLDELHSTEVALVIKFCLVIGQRIGEVTGLTGGELDLARKLWNIPAARSKNGFAHIVPLSPMAISLIGEADRSSLMNSGVWNISQARVMNVIREQLQFLRYPSLPHAATRVKSERWTAHDIRRTVLTKMAELGVAPIVLGHVANHRTTTKAGVTLGVYVQHAYEREKREALELWATRLQTIISG